MIKIKTQSNTVSITDTAVQATPLVEEEVEHINVKVSKVKMRTRSELATDNIYVTAKNMITLNQIHKGVDDAAVQIYPEPTIVAVPTLSGTYTYTGQEQTVTISTYDPAHIAVSGDTAATNAGTYTVVFSLVDTDADVWEDGTTEDKTATWRIDKAVGFVTLSKNIRVVNLNGTATVTVNASGNVTVASSASTIATASYSNGTITINGLAVGSATITVNAAESTNYLSAQSSIEVIISIFKVEPVSGSYVLNGDRRLVAGGRIGNYVLLCGGRNSNYQTYNAVEAYDNSLVHTQAPDMSAYKYGAYVASNSQYAVVTSGAGSGGNNYVTNAYNASLTRSIAQDSSYYEYAPVSFNTYALFGNQYKGIEAYNTSLTYSNPIQYSEKRRYEAGINVGNYALFAGGVGTDGYLSSIEAYDRSFTRNTNALLSEARGRAETAAITNRAFIIGGMGAWDSVAQTSNKDTVDTYNASLTRQIAPPLRWKVVNQRAVALSNYVLVAQDGMVEVYDSNLTKTMTSELKLNRGDMAVANNNYAFFAGGEYRVTEPRYTSNIIDIYQVA